MIGLRLWQLAGWTMLHYLWLGAAMGAAALLLRQRLRSAPANVRYLAALGSLLLLSVAPAAIALTVGSQLAPAAPSVSQVADSTGGAEAIVLRADRKNRAANLLDGVGFVGCGGRHVEIHPRLPRSERE